MSARGMAVPLVALFLSGLGADASALTLEAALLAAYRANAELQAERFEARSDDDAVSRALSGYRPKIYADAHYGGSTSGSRARDGDDLRETYGYGATIEQPLFDGFQTQHAVRAAEANVGAAREDLRAVENDILFRVASVYLDTLRDEGVVLHRRLSLLSLRRVLIGVNEQFARGQVTQTDVEQARVRVARARSDLDEAKANLKVSGLQLLELTQRRPAGLVMPKLPTAKLPTTLARARVRAEQESPIILAALSRAAAADASIGQAYGAFLPNARLIAGYDRSVNAADGVSDRDGVSIVGRVRVPLYQGGAASADVRQAKNRAASQDRRTLAARRKIEQAVGAAWAGLDAARSRHEASQRAVEAAEKALAGLREEHQIGARTVLDLLDGEREEIESRIALLHAARDVHVSAYLVLRAIGAMTIAVLVPHAEQYEPARYYNAVRGRWFGTSVDHDRSAAFLGEAPRLADAPEPATRGWTTRVRAETKR